MLEPGLQGIVEETVSDGMTASMLGSGDVDVLGTPALLAMVEAASIEAVAGALGEGQTTVGASVQLQHTAPSIVGALVIATSDLVEVDGRRLTFAFDVADPAGPIASGRHTRVIVDRERFVTGAETRGEG